MLTDLPFETVQVLRTRKKWVGLRQKNKLEPARWAWLAPKAFLTCPKLPNLLTNTISFGFLVFILAHNTGTKRLHSTPETAFDGPPPGGAHLPIFFLGSLIRGPPQKKLWGRHSRARTSTHAPNSHTNVTTIHYSARPQCAFTSQAKAPSARIRI